MASYTNPIPVGGVNPRKLRSEVYSTFTKPNQVMVSGPWPGPIAWVTSGDCVVDFGADSLSAGQQTTLTSVVAAHVAGSYVASPTVAQMALEPGIAGQTMWVPDAGVAGNLMVCDGTTWREGSSPVKFRNVKSGNQTGITTSKVAISGLAQSLAPGWWECELWLRYQVSATTATIAIDFDLTGLSQDNWTEIVTTMKSVQGSSAASGVAAIAGTVDDPNANINTTTAVANATTTYLMHVRYLAHITATSTVTPRVASVGTGTVSVMGSSIHRGREV